jgi:signal transduction histidine kinase
MVYDEQGNVTRQVGVSVDVSALKHTEQQLQEKEQRLRDLNKSLEERIAARTAELEQQTQRLRHLTNELTEAEQRERRRLARTLHDGLQQILIGVEIHLTLFAMDGEAEVLEHAQKLLKEATQASRSLAYELAPPALYNSDFSNALDWLVRWFGENHRFRVLIYAADDLPALPENAKVFLFNAIRELLLNSVKHSGVDEATVRCTPVGASELQIEVCDAGQGFDPAHVNQAAEIDHGFGLLSIRERLTALGGRLDITSAPGAGARFLIDFPLAVVDVAAHPPAMEPAAGSAVAAARVEGTRPGHRKRILLVDDHRIVREGLVAMLQRQDDFEVVGEAGNGVEAVELAEQLQPDVVLMDINLPHMDGIEATRRIKAQQPDVQVIGLSWHEEADMARAMRNAGAAAYLRKETASRTLIETLQGL